MGSDGVQWGPMGSDGVRWPSLSGLQKRVLSCYFSTVCGDNENTVGISVCLSGMYSTPDCKMCLHTRIYPSVYCIAVCSDKKYLTMMFVKRQRVDMLLQIWNDMCRCMVLRMGASWGALQLLTNTLVTVPIISHMGNPPLSKSAIWESHWERCEWIPRSPFRIPLHPPLPATMLANRKP